MVGSGRRNRDETDGDGNGVVYGCQWIFRIGGSQGVMFSIVQVYTSLVTGWP